MSSQTWTTPASASATDPWRRKSASAVSTSTTTTTLFTADTFGIWNRSFPQEDAWGNGVTDSKPVKNADNSDEGILLNKKSNPVEFRDLKRELDYYKLNAQILMQTKDLLEEKLEKVSQELQDLKLNAGSATNTVISRPTPAHLDSSSVASVDSSPSEDNLHLGSVSCSPPASSLKSYVKFNQENSFFNAKKHEGDYDVSLDVGKKSAWISAMENLTYVREEYKPPTVSKGYKSSVGIDQRRKSGSQYQIPSFSGAQINVYAPRYEEHEDRVEKHNGNISGDEYDMVSGVDESQWELCRHFLKGRCRYKRLCKFSHEVRSCPYCSIELPLSKIAASTHLSRCFRAKCGKPVTQPLTCGPNNNVSGVDMGVSNVKQMEPEDLEDSEQETTSNLEE